MSGKKSTEKHKAQRRGAIATPLHMAVNHRLIYNSKTEAERELGPLKNLTSERRIEELTRRLDRRVRKLCVVGLEDIVDAYEGARAEFLTDGLRDGQTGRRLRRQVRERFALRLFEWAYVATDEKAFERNRLDGRGVGLDAFKRYCDEPGGLEDINVCFTVLMHWGIVSPLRTGAKDYLPGQERNRRMRSLLLALKEELPPVGIFRTVPELDAVIREVEQAIIDERELTTLNYWNMLYTTGMTYWNIVATDPMRNAQLSTYCLPLKGLWIDETDGGRTRFWVFPANFKAAFSFTLEENGGWTFDAFEFIMNTHDLESRDVSEDFAVWYAMDDSRKLIERPGAVIESNDSVKYYGVELFWKHSEIVRFKLSPLGNSTAPAMTFRQIDEGFDGYRRFMAVVRKAAQFNSRHYPMIKIYNALLALDGDYIYLRDMDWQKERFMLEADDEGYYNYEIDPEVRRQIPCNLLDVLASGESTEGVRIYALPRRLHDPEGRVYEGRASRLRYVAENLTLQNQVTIYRFKDLEPVIFFNDFSIGMTWREAQAFGLRPLR